MCTRELSTYMNTRIWPRHAHTYAHRCMCTPGHARRSSEAGRVCWWVDWEENPSITGKIRNTTHFLPFDAVETQEETLASCFPTSNIKCLLGPGWRGGEGEKIGWKQRWKREKKMGFQWKVHPTPMEPEQKGSQGVRGSETGVGSGQALTRAFRVGLSVKEATGYFLLFIMGTLMAEDLV